MADPGISQVVADFYNMEAEKCEFNTVVNDPDVPEAIRPLIPQLSKECMKRYYGSGFVFPENIEGCRVLDMGCGSGSLVFLLAKLVGPTGYVVGVDICPDLIKLAKQESEYHYKQWGYDKANFEFHEADIKDVGQLGLGENSFDAIVSNGVFCLCPDQKVVYEAAFNLLKPGGQFLQSDVFTNKAQPAHLMSDPKLWSLGTTGSLVWDQLSSLVQSVGFTVPRLTQTAGVDVRNKEIHAKLSNADYVCTAYRLFKLPPGTKPRGAATVTYKGTISFRGEKFLWDMDTVFTKGQGVKVDSDTATILANTTFKDNFDFEDFAGDVKPSNQDPFAQLRRLESEGRRPTDAYVVE